MAIPGPRALRRVRSDVLGWYDRERRGFPWRGTLDPYAVLVSEVMLQQTQAARVAGRFERFLARFPTAQALAEAAPSAVLSEWSGLGYNRRALGLQRAAAAIARDGWPTGIADLERLPGIGPYTARAVASLAFGRPVGVVDTNVRRWLLRRFDVADTPRPLQDLADRLASAGDDRGARDWTHASMELGAVVCRPRRPACGSCPVAAGCPSHGSTPHVAAPRQAALRGSGRAYRGAVVRELSGAPGHAMSDAALRRRLDAISGVIGPRLDDSGWERIVATLERDGLIHRASNELRLGTTTIDA